MSTETHQTSPLAGPVRFLCGIGGSGMSPLAQVLRHRGERIRGSHRSFDRGQNARISQGLREQGIEIWPQDGSGVSGSCEVVASSAVEPDNPDIQAARSSDIPVRKRAALLADLFNGATEGIAIGGTSGKTTVTGMVGHILKAANLEPTVVNGGIMHDAAVPPYLGNAVCGSSDLFAVEADESDGTIALYRPTVAVITNISLDHKPLEELKPIFRQFADAARRDVIINADCPESSGLAVPKPVTFGLTGPDAQFRATDVSSLPDGSTFRIGTVAFHLRVPGRHNVANACAAVAACSSLEVPLEQAATALNGFGGIQRRLQILGRAAGVTVIDDFAHNPDKIRATLATLHESDGRIIAVFQPTGFGPTRLLKDGLVSAFCAGLEADDILLMPEIYYAGGTAVKDISSADVIGQVSAGGRQAEFIPEREGIIERVLGTAESGDRVVIMGARDNTLTEFGRRMLHGLGARPAGE